VNVTVAILGLIVSVPLSVVTMRLLWRRGRNEWERLVYEIGVRQVGLGGGILTSVVFTAVQMGGERDWLEMTMVAAWLIVVMFPLYLWAGYAWGRGMAAFFNVSRT
jgi:hypothetical protein